MNPYDFVRVDWQKKLERRQPIWHNRLVGKDGERLYSGHLEVDIFVETPLFIFDQPNAPNDPKKPALSIRNVQNEYIIPGSSLKGLLRALVETLGHGCFTIFDSDYEGRRINYARELPSKFHHCEQLTELCIACRTFGMLKERTRGVFLGKVNIGDAVAVQDRVYLYPEPFYTLATLGPKPHHASFYLDEERKHIAGRKFYFHHSPDDRPLTSSGLTMMGGKPANRYIQPVDGESQFRFRLDFTNLEQDELGALLLAVNLNTEMRHKIGSGKPLGLGSIQLLPVSLTLVDYARRYRSLKEGSGKAEMGGEDLERFIDEQVQQFSAERLSRLALQDLERIWRWPPAADVEYYYPSKRDWFDTSESVGKRIAETKNVP